MLGAVVDDSGEPPCDLPDADEGEHGEGGHPDDGGRRARVDVARGPRVDEVGREEAAGEDGLGDLQLGEDNDAVQVAEPVDLNEGRVRSEFLIAVVALLKLWVTLGYVCYVAILRQPMEESGA